MNIQNLSSEELSWVRSVFLAGFEAGGRDARTHPDAHDPWTGRYGERSELEFRNWLETAERRMVHVA